MCSNNDKDITANECNKLTKENFAERLKQAKSAAKEDIADFVKKKTDFDKKLININKKVTLNKPRYIVSESD